MDLSIKMTKLEITEEENCSVEEKTEMITICQPSSSSSIPSTSGGFQDIAKAVTYEFRDGAEAEKSRVDCLENNMGVEWRGPMEDKYRTVSGCISTEYYTQIS